MAMLIEMYVYIKSTIPAEIQINTLITKEFRLKFVQKADEFPIYNQK